MRILPFLFILISVLQLKASPTRQVYFSAALKAIPDLIVQARFNAANKVLAEAREADPENRAVDYLAAATLCMDLFVHAEEEAFETGLPAIEAYLERIEELPETEPWRNVFLGELKVALAVLHAKFKNNLKGGWQFYQAYGLLEENQQRFPSFVPGCLSFGVLQAALGSLPEDYRSIAALLGLAGDVDEGMRMLRKAYWRTTASEELGFLRNYYGFIYSFVNFQLFSAHEISPQSLNLPLKHEGFLVYLQALLEADRGQVSMAVQLLKNRNRFQGEKPFYYLSYLLGKYALSSDPELAHQNFRSFLARPGNNAYKKSTYRYLVWYHVLQDKPEKVEEYRQKILKEGNTALGADKQALLEAKAGFNFTLVKGRLYFDGGQYQKALESLDQQGLEVCCPEQAERIEWHYRKGRIYQEMEEPVKAVKAFEKAVQYPEAAPSYALANSYLQLGYLYTGQKRDKEAREVYKKVLKLKGFPFSEGLHQKAKVALSRQTKP